MKLFYRTLQISVLIIVLSGCHGPQSEIHITSESALSIDVSEVVRKGPFLELKDMIDTIEFVILETNGNSLQDMVSSIDVTDKYIYLNDNYKGGGFSIFGRNGRFVKRLPHGNGPEEMVMTRSFCIDNKKELLYICDPMASKLLRLSLDGTFIDYCQTESMCQEIYCYDDSVLYSIPCYITSDKEFEMVKTDTSFANYRKWILGPQRNRRLRFRTFQAEGDGVNIYKENEVYYLKGSTLIPKYVIKSNSLQELSANEIRNGKDMLADMAENDCILMNRPQESSDYLYMPFFSPTLKPRFVYYSKKTSEMWMDATVEGSLLYGIDCMDVSSSDSRCFIGIVSPYSVIRNLAELDSLISKSETEKFRLVKEDDNPIVVIFRLKNDFVQKSK